MTPKALAVGPKQELFVVDKSGRVLCFSTTGEFLRQWDLPAIASGSPSGLDVDAHNNLFVADTHYQQVLVYDSRGHVLRRFSLSAEGSNVLVSDVAVGPGGEIYVTEFGSISRVRKFSSDGHLLNSFGHRSCTPPLQKPKGICCDALGNVWVADASNHRLYHFDSEGVLLRTLGGLGDQPGKFRYPSDIAVSADTNYLVVADTGNNRIQFLDVEGDVHHILGRPGRGITEFHNPLNVDVVSNRVFIADSNNNRVVRFEAAFDAFPPHDT